MALESWICGCGRRVPPDVESCRCGRPRPTAAPQPAALPRAPSEGSIYQTTGVRAVGVLGLMVLVYFGSRACNRQLASNEAREQAKQALTGSIGAEGAAAAMGRYHGACFDQTYRTGWGRRQGSKFDEEQYVNCLLTRLRADSDFVADGRATGVPRPGARTAAPPPPTSRPLEPGPPRLSVQRVNGDRGTGVYQVEVLVTGGALPLVTFTSEQVICDGTPVWKQPGHRQFSLGYNGNPSLGVVSGHFRAPAGAQTCMIELALANEMMQVVTEAQTVQLF